MATMRHLMWKLCDWRSASRGLGYTPQRTQILASRGRRGEWLRGCPPPWPRARIPPLCRCAIHPSVHGGQRGRMRCWHVPALAGVSHSAIDVPLPTDCTCSAPDFHQLAEVHHTHNGCAASHRVAVAGGQGSWAFGALQNIPHTPTNAHQARKIRSVGRLAQRHQGGIRAIGHGGGQPRSRVPRRPDLASTHAMCAPSS